MPHRYGNSRKSHLYNGYIHMYNGYIAFYRRCLMHACVRACACCVDLAYLVCLALLKLWTSSNSMLLLDVHAQALCGQHNKQAGARDWTTHETPSEKFSSVTTTRG